MFDPFNPYIANGSRYDDMPYRRCGRSGLKLSACALGFWHNFGSIANLDNMIAMVTTAFDAGITYYDLANNYGPVAGAAEENFGIIMDKVMRPYRDEMIIATKAGYGMWPGPYGDFGSRKYLMASLDQSLKRMKLDYVDIFYHHRPDPETPMEETAGALADIVKSGKALYAGVSNYNPEQTKQMAKLLAERGVPLTIHQPRYNMLDRKGFEALEPVLQKTGTGSAAFCPLAQGLLTPKYLKDIPADSRAASGSPFLKSEQITDELREKLLKLNEIAMNRGQSLAQMAVAWDLRNTLTTVILGASRPSQITENVAAMQKLTFTPDELSAIDALL